MALTPANDGYNLAQLVARVAELEGRLLRLEQTRQVTMQAATVTSYIALSSTCVVQFTGTSNTKSVKFLEGWTPAAGDKCTFIDSPSWQGVFPVSIP